MSDRFDALLAFSRTLANDHIDEDRGAAPIDGSQSPQVHEHRTITVRGSLDGVALHIRYQSHAIAEIGGVLIAPEHDILEVFAAAPALDFEGRCKPRGLVGKLARLVGGGGMRGDHALFEVCRVDAEPGYEQSIALARTELRASLLRLCSRPDCRRVLLEAETGVTAVVGWGREFTMPDGLRALVEQILAVVRATGPA